MKMAEAEEWGDVASDVMVARGSGEIEITDEEFDEFINNIWKQR